MSIKFCSKCGQVMKKQIYRYGFSTYCYVCEHCNITVIEESRMIDWHTSEKEPVPFGYYAREHYPQIPCLVYIKGFGYGVRYWNVKEKCWDGEDCDDYYCDMDKVEKWAYVDKEE